MLRRSAHPARTVVLLPYAQLMPLATRRWAQLYPDGFSPRFETTRNWASNLTITEPGPGDLSQDVARDRLVALWLIQRAGLADRQALLLEPLIAAAHSLAPVAAAIEPARRSDWAGQLRNDVAGQLQEEAVAMESAVAQLALAWAGSSAYPTDGLFAPSLAASLDCVVLLQGFSVDPMHKTLVALWGDRVATLRLDRDDALSSSADTNAETPETNPAVPNWSSTVQRRGHITLHAAADAEDEASCAAACVLRHLEAGRVPVALAAVDRLLTRRVRALLASRQVAVRDETGWKLSTTRAAAMLMAALRACEPRAEADAVLDWLKNSPSQTPLLIQLLEAELRRAGVRDWRAALARLQTSRHLDQDWLASVQALRATMAGKHPLADWLQRLRDLLRAGGQWAALSDDPAGTELIRVLRLTGDTQQDMADLPAALWRVDLAEFQAWAGQVLESATFKPDRTGDEAIVILPLSQVLARPFAALVVAGCDEQRLPLSPEPPGDWTPSLRAAVGLPSREELAVSNLAAWNHAMGVPRVDLLWRTADDGGEALLPSALVRLLQAPVEADDRLSVSAPVAGSVSVGADPRPLRTITATPVARPLPSGAELAPATLSASAYDDLRRCPYRFFGLRQLGLSEIDEIDAELDKRDFGQWLHEVLKLFHEDLRDHPVADGPARSARLDDAAQTATRLRALDEAEFLPFAAAWPRVRDGYLDWLHTFEADGARFEQAELACEMPMGSVTLKGRIDRTDRLADGQLMVLDYKTENLGKSRDRVKQPTEDTQLLFYAALQDVDTLRAAYVNIGEKDGTVTVEQKQVVAARDLLVEGLRHDMDRITAGVPLPALGEGTVCDFCSARGLCRKDSWT